MTVEGLAIGAACGAELNPAGRTPSSSTRTKPQTRTPAILRRKWLKLGRKNWQLEEFIAAFFALNPQKPLPSDPHELEAGVLG